MKSLYARTTLLLACLGPVAHLPSQAADATNEQSALATVEARRAPLTLSPNGQWRLHVDANNVMHRVNLTDEKQAQRVALPRAGLRLAASRSGQRVAVTMGSACVALVDFVDTVATVPTLTWFPSGPSNPSAESPGFGSTEMPSEKDCGSFGLGNSPIAISTDGRWLATPSQVYDLDAKKVIAKLPVHWNGIGGLYPLKLEFVDNNTKLLMVTATLGEEYESLGSPSNLQFAVWDLSSKALYNLISLNNNATLWLPQSFFVDYSAQTGALYWVNADRYLRAQQSPKEGDTPPPLEVMLGRPGGCNSKPVSRFPVAAWDWVSFLMDPQGRWIAGVREVDAHELDRKSNKGFVEELVVFDLDTGRQIARFSLKEGVRGLVATQDGRTIYGLTKRATRPDSSMPAAETPSPNVGGELLEFRVDLRRVSTPRVSLATWDSTPCKIEDEAPSARSIHHQRRLLQPLWTVPVEGVTNLRQRALEKREEGVAGQSAANPTCTEQNLMSNSFIMQDKTVWLDKFSEIAQLDASSGRTIKTLPTPRKDNVCSVAVPLAGGFISYQGDTLSWRPFDAGAAARRVIEVRPGWYVSEVRAAANSFDAVWRAKPGTAPPKDEQVPPLDPLMLDLLIATHDAATQKRKTERRTNVYSYEMFGDEGDPAYRKIFLPACHDGAGQMMSGYDWQVSHFDSFRAYACGSGAAATKTVFWSHLDIAPRPVPPPAGEYAYFRRVWVLEGSTGVAQDGALMRVFDIATRREIAQIATSSPGAAQAVQLIESKGLLLIESLDYDKADSSYRGNLRAYSFK